jgi:hypothetical protein
MHLFHKWETLYQGNYDCGWFRHRRCNKCLKNQIISNQKFFGSISQAVELGVEIGIYKAVVEMRDGVKFDD